MPAVSQSDGASLGPVEVVELAATGKSPPPPSFDAILNKIDDFSENWIPADSRFQKVVPDTRKSKAHSYPRRKQPHPSCLRHSAT